MKRIFSLVFILLLGFVFSACGKEPSLSLTDADKSITLEIGKTKEIKPTIPEGFELEWISDKTDIAEVKAGEDTLSAVITAKKDGVAKITVTIVGEELSVEITVTVVKPDPTAVLVTGAGDVVAGNTLQLTGAVVPVIADQTLTWSSDNEAVATVDATGLVTAVSYGTAKITATSVKATVKHEVTVTVLYQDPTGITVTGADQVILGQEAVTYTASVAPVLANQEITWSVSDEGVATIDEDGVLTAVSAGTVIVIATSVTDSEVFGEKSVTVVLPDPTSIDVTGPDTLKAGESATFTATVHPALASQGVDWSVSKPNLASITAAGKLTAIAAGEVEVVATSKALNTIIGKKTVTIEVLGPTIEFELNGGSFPITATDSFLIGKIGSHALDFYNVDVDTYVANADKSIFMQNNGILTGSQWVHRICLNRNEAGFYEIEFIALSPNTTDVVMSQFEYILVAHNTYGPGYGFLGGLQVGQIISLTGFDITTAGMELDGMINVYPNSASVSMTSAPMAVGTTLPIPINGDKEFLGWYDNADFTGEPITQVSVAVKLYAKWEEEEVEPSVTVTGEDTLYVGETKTYTATVLPSNQSQEVIWSVSDVAIATIDENGVLTGVSEGTVTVKATSAAFGTVFGEKTVTVALAVPTGVTVTGADSLTVGETETYSATVLPSVVSQDVTWSVSDETIATIDEAGVLTAVKYGTVTVTATSVEDNTIVGTKEVQVYGLPTGISYRGPEQFIVGGTGKVYAQVYAATGETADQKAVTYSSSNPEVLTIDENGIVTVLTSGEVSITITSTINETKKTTKTITIHTEDSVFPLTEVVVKGDLVDKEALFFDYDHYFLGYNAFLTLEAALQAVPENAMIHVLEGTYSAPCTVTKNGITLRGEGGIITGTINVAATVSGLTVDDLEFTGKGQVVMAAAGGISNFTFKNNHVCDSTVPTTSAVIYFPNNGTAVNSNFVIENNIFEFVSLTSSETRYIRGGNISNITITGNFFEGFKGVYVSESDNANYVDAIRLEGTDSKNTAGSGVSGNVLISDNEFKDIGQRAIWLTRYSATSIKIFHNKIDYAGDQHFGGAIQLQTWASGQTTEIEIKFNTFMNIQGSFGIRLSNNGMLADATWTVQVNYNKFIDFMEPGTYDDFVQGYSLAAKDLINADYNYFSDPVDDTRMPFVGSYANLFETEADLEFAIELLLADPEYGMLIMEDDLETHANIAYADTLTVIGGIEWVLKEVYLIQTGDTNDRASAAEDNLRMLRLRGANVAYIEMKEYVDGLTTLVFDAKYYNSSHTTSVMKVSKQLEGETGWTEVATITLTAAYETQHVAINAEGNVKIRIDVTTKTANIDNIKFYQSVELYTQKHNSTGE